MYYYATPPSTDEIYHHGIKGMRWGVRRYENPDGTLTPLGKRRKQAYKQNQKYKRATYDEINHLLKDKALKSKFGNAKDIDEYDLGERFANKADFYGLNTSGYRKARDQYDKYYTENYRDIYGWEKYLKKKKKADNKLRKYKNNKNVKRTYTEPVEVKTRSEYKKALAKGAKDFIIDGQRWHVT